jgi:pimeloyl-ACP methyl ester carboxylesterase
MSASAEISPLWFGPAAAPLAGRLHAPPGAGRDLGVAICGPPFGWEDVCVYRPLRSLATVLAAAGLPTLRFDFPGTGDSAGGDDDPGRWQAWVAAVGDAVAAVRAAGPARCAVVGIGLGGSLAIAAIDDGLAVDTAVLWGTVVEGRTWLRQARAFQRVAGSNGALATRETERGEELAGFLLGAELRADLERLDLRAPADVWSVACTAVGTGRGDRTAVSAALGQRGVRPDTVALGALAPMLDEPHLARPATESFEAIRDYLVARSRPAASRPADVPVSAEACPVAGVSERILTVRAPDGVELSAVETRPQGSADSGRWVVFFNAAGVRHIGPNRMWVRFARTLAAAGTCSLRVDVRGVGDGGGDEVVRGTAAYYDPIVWDDSNLLAECARTLGARRLVLVGLCSGATAAFQVARRRGDVPAVVMLNPRLLEWDEQAATASEADISWRSATRPGYWLRTSRWRKVLRGQLPVRAVARGLGARVGLRLGATGGAAAQGPAAQLRALADAGVDVQLVIVEGDTSADFLARVTGGDPSALSAPHLDVRMLSGSDHTFRPLAAQEQVFRIIEELTARGT